MPPIGTSIDDRKWKKAQPHTAIFTKIIGINKKTVYQEI